MSQSTVNFLHFVECDFVGEAQRRVAGPFKSMRQMNVLAKGLIKSGAINVKCRWEIEREGEAG
jgi:hypothetical protein